MDGINEETHVVQRLVVYASAKYCHVYIATDFLELLRFPCQGFHLRTASEVHLVYKKEDGCIRAELLQRCQARLIVVEVLLHVSRLNFEDIDHDTDVLEDGTLLNGEVRVHECILTATVPEVQYKVAQEAEMVLLDVYRRPKTRCKRSRLIGTGSIRFN